MSDDLKARYFEEHIREKIGKALDEQRKIYNSRINSVGGDKSRGSLIRERLEGMSLDLHKEGEGVVARLLYPIEIRFFDMKRILDWKIYNRKLWGIMYKDLLGDIRHEFEDWIRANYPEQLRKYGFND